MATSDLLRRHRRHLVLLAGAGISSYAAYRLYHHPSVARKRRRIAELISALLSLADAISSSAETLALVSGDLNRFLRSDSDEIPKSLTQIAVIARSDDFAASISRVSEAVTVGIVRGVGFGSGDGGKLNYELADRVLNRVFSAEGSGFMSVVVGSFARNLVVGYYSRESEGSELFGRRIVDLIYDDRFRNLIGDCVQKCVGTAVAVFLEKTRGINTYNELFSGLTNPKHEAKIKEVLVSVCNGAVETLVRTSHQVMASSSGSSNLAYSGVEGVSQVVDLAGREGKAGWVSQVSSTLAVPSNRRFVLDVTGRVTFETVRSLLEFFLLKLHSAGRRSVSVFHEEVVERGLEVVRYVSAKSVTIFTICLALCVQLSIGTRLLVPV